MKCPISMELYNIFKKNHKNINKSLDLLLSSLDIDTINDCINLSKDFKLIGSETIVEIDEDNINTIYSIFKEVDNTLIQKLLWISSMFPEI